MYFCTLKDIENQIIIQIFVLSLSLSLALALSGSLSLSSSGSRTLRLSISLSLSRALSLSFHTFLIFSHQIAELSKAFFISNIYVLCGEVFLWGVAEAEVF